MSEVTTEVILQANTRALARLSIKISHRSCRTKAPRTRSGFLNREYSANRCAEALIQAACRRGRLHETEETTKLATSSA